MKRAREGKRGFIGRLRRAEGYARWDDPYHGRGWDAKREAKGAFCEYELWLGKLYVSVSVPLE